MKNNDFTPEAFGMRLAEIIAHRGVTQKSVAAAADVQPATMSAYIKGKASPSLDKLCLIANYLRVSTDYLLFNKPARQIDDEREDTKLLSQFSIDNDVVRHFGSKILKANADRMALVTDVAQRIALDITGAVDNALKDRMLAPSDEVITPEGVGRLERYSLETLVAVRPFHTDETDESERSSRFADIIASNIRKGYKFRFLIPNNCNDYAKWFLRHIESKCDGRFDLVSEHVSIRETESFPSVGFALLKLDVFNLEKEQAILYSSIKNYFYPEKRAGEQDKSDSNISYWLGHVISPVRYASSFVLFEPEYIKYAHRSFETLWEGAKNAPTPKLTVRR